MKHIIMAAVIGLGLLAAPAFAADTSVTVVRREAPKPVGEFPSVVYVHATATAAGSMTYDLLPPKSNLPAAKIVGCVTTVEKADGTQKLLKATRSGNTMTIAAGASDTLVVSDTARTQCVLRP